MTGKVLISICISVILCLGLTALSSAADEQGTCQQKSFWQKLFNYPANVTKDSAKVVSKAGRESANVVISEVKTIGQVASGDVKKTGDLITEPVKGSAQTVVDATEGTVKMPMAAAKEEPTTFTQATKAAVEETAKIASETTAGAVVDTAKTTTDAVQAPVKGSK